MSDHSPCTSLRRFIVAVAVSVMREGEGHNEVSFGVAGNQYLSYCVQGIVLKEKKEITQIFLLFRLSITLSFGKWMRQTTLAIKPKHTWSVPTPILVNDGRK